MVDKEMTREDIIRMAREVGFFVLMPSDDVLDVGGVYPDNDDEISKELQHFAQLVAAAEREACAKVCEEKQQYAMPIPCPDGIDGCSVMHCVPARREKTGQECAEAIRARGEK